MSPSFDSARARRIGARPAAACWLDGLRRAVDDVRVRAHLRRTERGLRAADTDHLSAEQRRRRERHLDRLREYRERGAFPTNRVAAERVPCFVGANDVPCALAALLLADGREDLVERVAATDNTVRIEDCTDEELLAWLDENGLTRAEAARVQPAYDVGVHFVTDCGPVSCSAAKVLLGLLGAIVFAGLEAVGYRIASGAFPDNVLKRRATLGYLTVLNLLLVPLLVAVTFALLP